MHIFVWGGKGVGGGGKERGRKEQGPVQHIFQFNLSDLVLILILLLNPNRVTDSPPGPQFNFAANPIGGGFIRWGLRLTLYALSYM